MSRSLAARAVLAFALAGGCGGPRGWMADESYRIDKVMHREHFCQHVAGAQGIAVEDAPPLAPPSSPTETYRFHNERDRRVSSARRQSAPRARRRSASADPTDPVVLR